LPVEGNTILPVLTGDAVEVSGVGAIFIILLFIKNIAKKMILNIFDYFIIKIFL
jgi:hypothetical protein